MSHDKSILTQNTLNDSLHNIVTERAPPLHAHNQFVDKFQRELEKKKQISFGTLQNRKSQVFAQKNQQGPGPGFYNTNYPNQNMIKKAVHSKSTPFGMSVTRFKSDKIRTSPGPGAYLREKENKVHSKRRLLKVKKAGFKQPPSQQDVPGPGAYHIDQQNIIEKRRNFLKEKYLRLKQKRAVQMEAKKKNNEKNCQKTLLETVRQNSQKSIAKTSKARLDYNFRLPCTPLERNNLTEKTRKYLPLLTSSKDSYERKRKQCNIYNYSNCFLEKNDNAYEAYIPIHKTSAPGIYHKEKEVLIYDKKSSFFISSSPRYVF